MPSDAPRGRLMPNWNDQEWGPTRITIRPHGWRNMPVAGKLLRKWPYFTGSQPVINIAMRPKLKHSAWDPVTVSYSLEVTGRTIDHGTQTLMEPGKVEVPVPWLVDVGPHQLLVSMGRRRDTDKLSDVLATFDVKSSDTLALLVMAIVGSLIIGLMASAFGAWLAPTFFQSQDPVRVIVVDEIRTPTPASPPETGSDEG